jgi:hypothetical protein
VAFMQILTYSTSKRAEMDAARRQWIEDTEDVRRARNRILLRDRESTERYVELLFFDSYEDAMHNSSLPATRVLAEAAVSFTEGGLEFQNLDVVDEGF